MDNIRKIFSNANLISSFLKGLTKVDMHENGWSSKYLDSKTGQEWLLYPVSSEYHSGGYCDNHLIRLPEPLTVELIEIALTSKYEDEIIAAALRLRDNEEFRDIDFRQQLIDKLEQIKFGDIPLDEKQRLINLIEYSELNNERNRREILNKTDNEIKADFEFFKKIKSQADNMLQQLNET